MVTDVHYTLFHDLTNSDQSYAENWADLIEGEIFNVEAGCYIIALQGIAVEAKLNPSVEQ